jgi:hypothetical protein
MEQEGEMTLWMGRTNRTKARFSTAAAVGLGLGLAACGGGGGGSSPAAPTVSQPVRSVIGQTNWTAEAGTAARVDAVFAVAGTMDVTANWTFTSNDVDIYVTSTACAVHQDLLANRCTLLARADGVSTKPERLTLAVQQGTLRIWLANFGPTNESGNVEIGLTR